MPITLDAVTFDETNTAVREILEEVGGRDERKIIIEGLITLRPSVADIESDLDAILDSASMEDYSASLSLRDGRRLRVRRNKFTRDLDRDSLAGSFTLELEARTPFEESIAATTVNWNVTASGQTQAVTPGGNVFSKPAVTLTATGDLINPSFSDGTRTLTYSGTVRNGESVLIDADAGVVTLDGVDVTPYTTGEFPRLETTGTTLTYTDDPSSSHTAAIAIVYHDRWW